MNTALPRRLARWRVVGVLSLFVAVAVLACSRHEPVANKTTSVATQTEVTIMTSQTNLSFATFQQKARDAQLQLGWHLSPAFPNVWPPRPGEVPYLEWYAYHGTPLPTGTVSTALEGPRARVVISLPAGEAKVEVMRDATAKGSEGDFADSVSLERAQQALLDVLVGLRTPEDARAELLTYVRWAEWATVRGPDLRRRKHEFFAWLEQ